MSKKGGSDAGGCLLLVILAVIVTGGGLAALENLLTGAIVIGALAVIVFVAIKAFAALDARPPDRTVTHSTTWLGDKKKTIEYHDTGKEVEQITSRGLLGGTTKKTYVRKPGRRSHRTRWQTCNNCGASVASTDGSYYCSCGRRWGRR